MFKSPEAAELNNKLEDSNLEKGIVEDLLNLRKKFQRIQNNLTEIKRKNRKPNQVEQQAINVVNKELSKLRKDLENEELLYRVYLSGALKDQGPNFYKGAKDEIKNYEQLVKNTEGELNSELTKKNPRDVGDIEERLENAKKEILVRKMRIEAIEKMALEDIKKVAA